MALIGRFFVIFFGLVLAIFAAGNVVAFALFLPELKDGTLSEDSLNVILGFLFILIDGFALLPALLLVLIAETFYIRHILAYAIVGALAGLSCYLAFIPFDTVTMTFTGIVRRHLEVMVGAGVVGGVVYWLVAGRNAGLWRGGSAAK